MASAAATAARGSAMASLARRSGRPGRGRGLAGAQLVTGEAQHGRGRAHEGHPGRRAGVGVAGGLRLEAGAGVARVGAAAHGGAHDLVGVQVAAQRPVGVADLVGLVGLGPVQRHAVRVGVDRHGGQAQLVGGPQRADRDLPAVRDQDLADHASPCRRCPPRGPPGCPMRGPASSVRAGPAVSPGRRRPGRGPARGRCGSAPRPRPRRRRSRRSPAGWPASRRRTPR